MNLTSNTGATINFNAAGNGLDITTTTGIGFNATGPGPLATSGGTVTVLGSGNSINSTNATAFNVANTTIGASEIDVPEHLGWDRVGRPAKGISLNNAGSGGFTVTGVGSTEGSGGTNPRCRGWLHDDPRHRNHRHQQHFAQQHKADERESRRWRRVVGQH